MTVNNRKSRFDSLKQETLQKFLKQKEETEKEIFMLESIKRETKKDGTDFQAFLKNFSCPEGMSIYYGDLDYIKIWYKGSTLQFQRYTVDEDFIKEIEKAEPERIVKHSYIRDHVYYTPNEFMQVLQKRLAQYREYLEKLNNTIENFEKTAQELEKRLNGVLDFLNGIEDQYYDIRELAKETIDTFYK